MNSKRLWILLGGVAALAIASAIWMTDSFSGTSPYGSGWSGRVGIMNRGWADGMTGMHGGGMGAMHGSMWGGGSEQLPPTSSRPNAPRRELPVSLQEWRIDPSELEAVAGERLVITVRNDGKVPHNFAIPNLGVRLVNIPAGGSRVIELDVDQPGSYPYLCDIAGHGELGQKGILTVKQK